MESGQDRVPHLVIVDDEPVILQILRNVFEDEPYRLTCVNNGTDAVRVSEALHAFHDAAMRVRRAAPFLVLQTLLALVEEAIDTQAEALARGGTTGAKLTVRCLCALDKVYFELLYVSVAHRPLIARLRPRHHG